MEDDYSLSDLDDVRQAYLDQMDYLDSFDDEGQRFASSADGEALDTNEADTREPGWYADDPTDPHPDYPAGMGPDSDAIDGDSRDPLGGFETFSEHDPADRAAFNSPDLDGANVYQDFDGTPRQLDMDGFGQSLDQAFDTDAHLNLELDNHPDISRPGPGDRVEWPMSESEQRYYDYMRDTEPRLEAAQEQVKQDMGRWDYELRPERYELEARQQHFADSTVPAEYQPIRNSEVGMITDMAMKDYLAAQAAPSSSSALATNANAVKNGNEYVQHGGKALRTGAAAVGNPAGWAGTTAVPPVTGVIGQVGSGVSDLAGTVGNAANAVQGYDGWQNGSDPAKQQVGRNRLMDGGISSGIGALKTATNATRIAAHAGESVAVGAVPGLGIASYGPQTLYTAAQGIGHGKQAHDLGQVSATAQAENSPYTDALQAAHGRMQELTLRDGVQTTAYGMSTAGDGVTLSGVGAPIGLPIKAGGQALEFATNMGALGRDSHIAKQSQQAMQDLRMGVPGAENYALKNSPQLAAHALAGGAKHFQDPIATQGLNAMGIDSQTIEQSSQPNLANLALNQQKHDSQPQSAGQKASNLLRPGRKK
ncbi:hypothetical protein [Gloeobacter morelensis]|uniref:Uncharacterized protein n=1 Tax=Gloeobacter morelensis MG652769 TaxID=2781736 RepID=A0ABY3PQ26_9CYAN|nr:hypothetical protein [Gloeobacter morelensis]UFP95807.1 hypothetical protein ISF26_06125 [Gloeobacter morelensis MG652769]